MGIGGKKVEMEKGVKMKKGKGMDVDKGEKENGNGKDVEEYILDWKGI